MENLLLEVEKLYSEYEERQDEQSKQGLFYNVFYVLGLWSDEVKFHSRFISDLLKPNGWHHQKDVFLKEFCNLLGYDDLITEKAEVEVEKYIGKISPDKKHGGKLDIYIILKDNYGNPFTIIIENKIYANDQPNQLLRYWNYAKENFDTKYKILYLTLDGHNPNKKSVGFDCNKNKYKLKSTFWRNLSYSTLIKEWLKRCMNIVNDKPNILNVIKQYYDLQMELIGQGVDSKMSTDIQNLLMKKHNLRGAENLSKEIEATKQKIIEDNLKQICEEIKQNECPGAELTFKMNYYDHNQYFEYVFNNNIKITFGFDGKFEQNFFYGIRYNKDIDKDTRQKIRKIVVNEKNNEEHNQWWLWSRYCDDRIDDIDLRNWSVDVYDLILNEPKKIQNYFGNILHGIIQALKDNKIL